MKRFVIGALLCALAGFVAGVSRVTTQTQITPTHIVELRERAAAAETVFVRDTVRFHYWSTVYDTIRSTLRITDTMEVVRYVKAADSTIGWCRESLRSCGTLLAKRDSVIREQAFQMEKTKPPRSLKHDILILGIGAALGVFAPRP